jgi:hypothetical protein
MNAIENQNNIRRFAFGFPTGFPAGGKKKPSRVTLREFSSARRVGQISDLIHAYFKAVRA